MITKAGRVKNLLKNETEIIAQEYDVCINGCKLFDNMNNEEECPHCHESRFKFNASSSQLVPAQTMKMMSIGDQISKLLSDDETRKSLHYSHSRESIPGYVSDYFDGETYKAFKSKNYFTSPDDIAIVLYVDGFVTQKKSKQELVIIHVLVLNYDPSIR